MGTPVSEGARRDARPPSIARFYSSGAWIEGRAEDQLSHVAGWPGVQHIAAFPDLHPGKLGPVGCAIAATRLYPHLIGNDIGCGMTLFALDLPVRKIRIDKAAARMRQLGADDAGPGHAPRLAQLGLPADLAPLALGTIGGGNHFCELQAVDQVMDPVLAQAAGLDPARACLLVHSGSRSVGERILRGLIEDPALDLGAGLAPGTPAANAYLARHDEAVAWASLNRLMIAERAATALHADLALVCDAPHNLVSRDGALFVHRKGAARADAPCVPLAGSRDALSYLVHPTGADADTLGSLAHGAGRKYDRASMRGRAGRSKSELHKLERTSFNGRVICEDKALLIEEAPVAYKSSARVLAEMECCGIARSIAALRPLVTFKKTRTVREGRA